jgi:multidrug efflux pump subunit AcrA (membrane-fusion protein)
MPVNVLSIEYTDSITQSRRFTGTIRAKNRSELGFERPGKITQVFVDEGDTISAGSPIAKLDVETLLAQKNAAIARRDQARSMLAELESGPRQETIAAARAVQAAARSRAEMAQANLDRRKMLFEKQAISQEEFDVARYGVTTASANLRAADEQLSELESGTRQEQLDAQISMLRQLDASIAEIEVAISKSTLLAPFNGTVTERFLDPGSVAQVSAPVVRLVDEQNLEAWIGLPVAMVSQLAIGSQQEIWVGQKPYPATVVAKIRELDTVTRTQTVLFRIEPYNTSIIVSGQLCEINLSSQSPTSGFWIPNTALAKGVRGLWSVLALTPETTVTDSRVVASMPVVDSAEGQSPLDDAVHKPAPRICRVEKRDVEVLVTESNRVLVRGTLSAGDRVVVDGVHRITSGQLVEARD